MRLHSLDVAGGHDAWVTKLRRNEPAIVDDAARGKREAVELAIARERDGAVELVTVVVAVFTGSVVEDDIDLADSPPLPTGNVNVRDVPLVVTPEVGVRDSRQFCNSLFRLLVRPEVHVALLWPVGLMNHSVCNR